MGFFHTFGEERVEVITVRGEGVSGWTLFKRIWRRKWI
jgi:hypothetical protein